MKIAVKWVKLKKKCRRKESLKKKMHFFLQITSFRFSFFIHFLSFATLLCFSKKISNLFLSLLRSLQSAVKFDLNCIVESELHYGTALRYGSAFNSASKVNP